MAPLPEDCCGITIIGCQVVINKNKFFDWDEINNSFTIKKYMR